MYKSISKKIAKKIGDRGPTIAIGSQALFQIEIGIAITISISTKDRDRDRDLNFGDRGHALQTSNFMDLVHIF